MASRRSERSSSKTEPKYGFNNNIPQETRLATPDGSRRSQRISAAQQNASAKQSSSPPSTRGSSLSNHKDRDASTPRDVRSVVSEIAGLRVAVAGLPPAQLDGAEEQEEMQRLESPLTPRDWAHGYITIRVEDIGPYLKGEPLDWPRYSPAPQPSPQVLDHQPTEQSVPQQPPLPPHQTSERQTRSPSNGLKPGFTPLDKRVKELIEEHHEDLEQDQPEVGEEEYASSVDFDSEDENDRGYRSPTPEPESEVHAEYEFIEEEEEEEQEQNYPAYEDSNQNDDDNEGNDKDDVTSFGGDEDNAPGQHLRHPSNVPAHLRSKASRPQGPSGWNGKTPFRHQYHATPPDSPQNSPVRSPSRSPPRSPPVYIKPEPGLSPETLSQARAIRERERREEQARRAAEIASNKRAEQEAQEAWKREWILEQRQQCQQQQQRPATPYPIKRALSLPPYQPSLNPSSPRSPRVERSRSTSDRSTTSSPANYTKRDSWYAFYLLLFLGIVLSNLLLSAWYKHMYELSGPPAACSMTNSSRPFPLSFASRINIFRASTPETTWDPVVRKQMEDFGKVIGADTWLMDHCILPKNVMKLPLVTCQDRLPWYNLTGAQTLWLNERTSWGYSVDYNVTEEFNKVFDMAFELQELQTSWMLSENGPGSGTAYEARRCQACVEIREEQKAKELLDSTEKVNNGQTKDSQQKEDGEQTEDSEQKDDSEEKRAHKAAVNAAWERLLSLGERLSPDVLVNPDYIPMPKEVDLDLIISDVPYWYHTGTAVPTRARVTTD